MWPPDYLLVPVCKMLVNGVAKSIVYICTKFVLRIVVILRNQESGGHGELLRVITKMARCSTINDQRSFAVGMLQTTLSRMAFL